jgi:hypothetical protein
MLCMAAGWVGRGAAADLFVLRQGGRLRGTWLNRQEPPPAQYAILTEEGAVLKLDASEVRLALPQDAKTAEYERRLERCVDTVTGHWELAEWCREQGCKDQRESHLQRILDLDPDHAGARHALGYSQLGGQWVTRDGIQQRRGYQRYAGRWRLPQEIELIEASQGSEQAQKRWLAQMVRWREMLNTSASREAYQGFESVRDPQAVRGLTTLLKQETYRQVKLLYVDALERIGTPPAIDALVDGTLRDPDDEIFHACLEKIIRLRPPNVEKRYVAALKDESNVRVNRAAYALGQLREKSVLSPLISALVTTHTIVIPKASDAYTATFARTDGGSPLGGTGFSAGGEPLVISQTVTNQEVLTALIRLSGGINYGFDKQAWQYWLDNENQRSTPAVNARRGGP